MSVAIHEIILGQKDGQTDRVEPKLTGLSIIPVSDPELWHQATLEALSEPNERSSSEAAPFIRIRAEDKDLSIAIADDAMARVRILEESLEQRIPLMIDASLDDETDAPKRDVMLTKLARAFGVAQAELLPIALTQNIKSTAPSEYSEAEEQYLKSYQHALQLAQQVRKIDDQMTASVVPGWLFVACGVGAVFVMMTAVTLFYPGLRMTIIPIMVVLGVLGLSAYAWRSFQELKIRASLQENRSQLRGEREKARSETRALADELKAAGNDPDALIVHATEGFRTASNPVILVRKELSAPDIEVLESNARQTLIFTLTELASEDVCKDFLCTVESLNTPSSDA